MSKTFIFNPKALAFIALVGLGIGSVTPIAHAEAPEGQSYITLSPISSIHEQIASIFTKDEAVEKVVDGMTASERAAKIDQFFASRDNSPFAGYGKAFVTAADKYDIDWKLLAAISTIESNGGQQPCKYANGNLKYNGFGWGGCKVAFKSYEEAIDHITKNLAGLVPETERHYKGKTIDQIINTYNPPHIRSDYNYLVNYVMKKIATTDTTNHIAMK